MEKTKIPDVAAEAEAVILKLKERGNNKIFLKTSQLRKFLSAVNAVTNRVMVYHAQHIDEKRLPVELASEVKYLKVKFAYQAGRMREVREFGETARIKEHIDRVGDSFQAYQCFARYMEALVAYHKFYGGQEK